MSVFLQKNPMAPPPKRIVRLAAQQGHEAEVRELIGLGADVSTAIDDGTMPLFMAVPSQAQHQNRKQSFSPTVYLHL